MLLVPIKEQEDVLFKYVNYFRYAYNWGIEKCNKNYDLYSKGLGFNELSRLFTQYKKTHEDFYTIDSHTLKEALKNVDTAYKNFYKGINRLPRFKSYKTAKKSFYTRQDRLKLSKNKVCLSSIGEIKAKPCHWLLNNILPEYLSILKVYKPYVVFDNKYWYLSFGIEVNVIPYALDSDKSIGVDLGINNTIITSEGVFEPNINDSYKVLKLEKRKKRLQRKISRKYRANGFKKVKSNNIKKLEKKIRLIYRHITNIRDNFIHEIINKVIKSKPHKIVLENLNVKGMLRNKHLAKRIHGQRFYKIYMLFNEKAKNSGIQIITADRWFPSSKLCSNCGTKKKDLRLSDRVYKCDYCGLTIDRDLNASLNLSKYTC